MHGKPGEHQHGQGAHPHAEGSKGSGGHPGGHPGGGPDKSGGRKWMPRLIAWELTRSCNLNCIHCRAAARFGPYPNELTTEECFKFLDNVASFSNPIMIMTGGEPMLRDDIYDIAKYGTKLGLRMVMAPCGFLVTEETAQKMLDSGIQRLSFSIDGATAKSHDDFRRVEGAFDSVMTAIENAKKVGMEFQVNTTITKHNLEELPDILELVIKLGAKAHHPFLLVPTGRGEDLKDQEISPEDYEKTLTWFYDMRDKVPLMFKPTCAPHYYRIFRQKRARQGHKGNAGDPRYGRHEQGLHGRPVLRLRLEHRQGADLRLPRGGVRRHSKGVLRQDMGYLEGLSGDARLGRLRGQMRLLRVSARSAAGAGQEPSPSPATIWRRSPSVPTSLPRRRRRPATIRRRPKLKVKRPANRDSRPFWIRLYTVKIWAYSACRCMPILPTK